MKLLTIFHWSICLFLVSAQGVEAGKWTPASLLGPSGSESPAVAVNANGDSVAVWYFSEGIFSTI